MLIVKRIDAGDDNDDGNDSVNRERLQLERKMIVLIFFLTIICSYQIFQIDLNFNGSQPCMKCCKLDEMSALLKVAMFLLVNMKNLLGLFLCFEVFDGSLLIFVEMWGLYHPYLLKSCTLSMTKTLLNTKNTVHMKFTV